MNLKISLLLWLMLWGFGSCNGQITNGNAPQADSLKAAADTVVVGPAAPPSDNIFRQTLGTMDAEIREIDRLLDSLAHIATLDSAGQILQYDRKERLAVLQEQRAYFDAQLKKYAIEGNEVKKIKSEEGRSFSCYVASSASDVRFFWKDSTGKVYGDFERYQQQMEKDKHTLVFATNGGMYMPDQSPQGWYVERGKELQKIDLAKGKHGNFYMQPNGVFLITKTKRPYVIVSENYKSFKDSVLYATQSGPMLLVDGQINAQFTANSPNFHIRSGVGVDDKGRMVFIISDERVRFYELAQAFQAMGCANALYLDGAISETYLPELGLNQKGGGFGVMIAIVK